MNPSTQDRIIRSDLAANIKAGIAVAICAAALVVLMYCSACASTPEGTQRRVQNYAALIVRTAVDQGDIDPEAAPAIAKAIRAAAQAIRTGEFQPGDSVALAAKAKEMLSAEGYGALVVDILFTEADIYLLEHGPKEPSEKAAVWADFLDGVAAALEGVGA